MINVIIKQFAWFCVLTVMVAGHVQAETEGRVSITLDGSPSAVIVLPDNPHRTELFAAEELSKYIKQISGAELSIINEKQADNTRSRLLVGSLGLNRRAANRLREMDQDGYAVIVERQVAGEFIDGAWNDEDTPWHDISLVGVGKRGTLYAVYDFLERELGCRWLGPGELWEEIPNNADLNTPVVERVEQPAMRYRGDYALENYDWGLKHRVNISRRIGWPFDWMRFGDQEELPVDMRGWLGVHEVPRMMNAAARETDSDTSTWFALDDKGKRGGDICFSNPEVHDVLAQRLSMLLRARPELDFVELGCDDGLPHKYCRCDDCMAWDVHRGGARGVHTHRWLMLVNAVAERLAKSDPGKYLLAAAYSSYQQPPDPQVITPADNVIVMYWTWDGCRMHGFKYNDEGGRHSRYREWLETWGALTPAGIMVAEYHSRNAMDGITGVNPRRYVQDMRYLRDNNSIGYLAFAPPLPWGFFLVNRYAAVKAMWNPDIDEDALVKDFCDHAFHAASDAMQDFIAVIENAMQLAKCGRSSAASWITPEVVAEARRHLNTAHAVAQGDEKIISRLRPFEWHFRFAEMHYNAFLQWREASAAKDPALMREALKSGEAALAYRREMRKEFPDEPFPVGWRLERFAGPKGAWHGILERMEKGKNRSDKE